MRSRVCTAKGCWPRRPLSGRRALSAKPIRPRDRPAPWHLGIRACACAWWCCSGPGCFASCPYCLGFMLAQTHHSCIGAEEPERQPLEGKTAQRTGMPPIRYAYSITYGYTLTCRGFLGLPPYAHRPPWSAFLCSRYHRPVHKPPLTGFQRRQALCLANVILGVKQPWMFQRSSYDAVLGALGVPAGIANENRYFYRSSTGTFGITTPSTVSPPPMAMAAPSAFWPSRRAGRCLPRSGRGQRRRNVRRPSPAGAKPRRQAVPGLPARPRWQQAVRAAPALRPEPTPHLLCFKSFQRSNHRALEALSFKPLL